jgi:cyclopropane-fatty-acyl-phospholipid synthase
VRKQIEKAGDSATKGLAVLKSLLGDYHPRDFTIRFWNDDEWPAETGSRFTLVFNHPQALRRMLRSGASDLGLSEAYIYGELDLEGDLEAAMPLASHLFTRRWSASRLLQVGWNLFRMSSNGQSGRNGRQAAELSGEVHSIERDRQAVAYHYDLSNDFYALWLDQRMVYSCAYFEKPDEDLDSAQERKLDYLCHKLRLRPGERLLDIGCGWGGLIIHATQHYGVEAVGITLSQNQATLANQRIAQAGLQNRCRVEVCDYRDLRDTGSFDKLVSVGMFEHVGENRLLLYFQHAWKLLRTGGVFLNHGIALRASERWPKGPTFLSRYVFPDGELVPINTTLYYAEEAGFEVRDVESLREHYALTLRHWARRLDQYRDQAMRAVDEATYRVWRLFLSGSAHGFTTGALNVYQALLLKPDRGYSNLPLTRRDWYERSTSQIANSR